jgi:hypothetical protein
VHEAQDHAAAAPAEQAPSAAPAGEKLEVTIHPPANREGATA